MIYATSCFSNYEGNFYPCVILNVFHNRATCMYMYVSIARIGSQLIGCSRENQCNCDQNNFATVLAVFNGAGKISTLLRAHNMYVHA